MSESRGTVAIVGSGIVGQAWASLFSRANYAVRMYDVDSAFAGRAIEIVRTEKLPLMAQYGLLKESVDIVASRITVATTLEAAIDGVVYIQENVPELLDLKQLVFGSINKALLALGKSMSDDITTLPVIASSSSALPMSKIAEGLEFAPLCLVAHPVNPPSAIPLVELVPSPTTLPEIAVRARAIQTEIGQAPISLKKETPGFVLNRLQYALLAEAVRLVEDGVCTPEDVDTAVSEGLGRRWAFMGPFQTIDLNAPNGVLDYCERYTNGILSIVKEQDNSRDWTPETIAEIDASMRVVNGDVSNLPNQAKWRDDRLLKLTQHFNECKK